MPDHRPFTREFPGFWFAAAVAWAVVIFLTVPYAPKITGTLTAWINDQFAIDWGYALIGHAAVVVLALVLAWAGWSQRAHRAWRSPGRLLVITGSLAAYAIILPRMEIAAEKLHFLQYGFLAWLFWRGWRLVVASPAIWAISFFCGAFVGVLDEGLQYVTPGRHGESVDMLWNILAAGLPLVLVSAFSERSRERHPSSRDGRLIRSTGLIFFLPLFGFLFLAQQYGTRVDDPRGYLFRTRLESADALRRPPPLSSDVITELQRETPYTYSDFLERHSEATEPHLNEFRVHLYRRDRYLGQAGHSRLRRLAAGVTPETSSADRRALESALAQPEAVRALRAYAALYMGDWLRDRHGADLLAETVAGPMRAWIAGTDTTWGAPLWEAYLAEHDRKASSEGAPATMKERDDLWIAWSEHRILSDWFPEYTSATTSGWSAGLEDAAWLVVRDDERRRYESAVAERVLDRGTRSAFALVAFLVVGLVIAFPGAFASRRGAVLILFILSQGWALTLSARARTANQHERLAPSHPAVMLIAAANSSSASSAPPLTLAGLQGETDVVSTLCALDGTPTALLVSFRVTDTDVVARQATRDGELWRDDAVEVFLDTEGLGRRYVEIQVNPDGVVSDALVEWSLAIDFASAVRWDARGLEAKTTRDSEVWTAAIMIPWAALGMPGPPPPGSALRANFCRVDRDRREPPSYSYQAWSPTRGWFHRPQKFGSVRVSL